MTLPSLVRTADPVLSLAELARMPVEDALHDTGSPIVDAILADPASGRTDYRDPLEKRFVSGHLFMKARADALARALILTAGIYGAVRRRIWPDDLISARIHLQALIETARERGVRLSAHRMTTIIDFMRAGIARDMVSSGGPRWIDNDVLRDVMPEAILGDADGDAGDDVELHRAVCETVAVYDRYPTVSDGIVAGLEILVPFLGPDRTISTKLVEADAARAVAAGLQGRIDAVLKRAGIDGIDDAALDREARGEAIRALFEVFRITSEEDLLYHFAPHGKIREYTGYRTRIMIEAQMLRAMTLCAEDTVAILRDAGACMDSFRFPVPFAKRLAKALPPTPDAADAVTAYLAMARKCGAVHHKSFDILARAVADGDSPNPTPPMPWRPRGSPARRGRAVAPRQR